MCSKSDNSCREEKLGCKNCYYRLKNGIPYGVVRDALDKSIVHNIKIIITTNCKEDFIEYCLDKIHEESYQTIQYLIKKKEILVLKDNKIRVIIKERM